MIEKSLPQPWQKFNKKHMMKMVLLKMAYAALNNVTEPSLGTTVIPKIY